MPSFQAQQASASSQRAWSAPICSSQYSSPFVPVDSALASSDGASRSSAVGHCCLDVSESGEMVASETPSVKVSRATSFQWVPVHDSSSAEETCCMSSSHWHRRTHFTVTGSWKANPMSATVMPPPD